ncbi:MAG: hypothetical protein ABEJ34_05560 [Haloferacaceae archaeon]
MGHVRIRDEVHCRTVPAPNLDGEITVDLAGEGNEVVVPAEVTVTRR